MTLYGYYFLGLKKCYKVSLDVNLITTYTAGFSPLRRLCALSMMSRIILRSAIVINITKKD